MMNGLKSIRRERAMLERNRVVIGSMFESEEINAAIEEMATDYIESVTDEEIEAMIDKIPESDDEDEQIEKILLSDSDMDVDDVLGVDDEVELDEE